MILVKAALFLLLIFLAPSCSRTVIITRTDTAAQEINNEIEPITEQVITEQITEEQIPPVMVCYEGRILNIFFHPLVARPETAFNSSRRDYFLDWYITASEYRNILFELYIGGYVLVDIKELYEVNYENGRKNVFGKKPLIPEGKKPLVLSVDDLSYYPRVREYASVHKLVIDEHGGIAAWTDSPDGGELSYDLDVVTYLEEFVKKYPDFSVRGARGIIGMTGYLGVLGYQTHESDAPEYREEKVKAIAVADKLKKMGWHFASHSWGHPDLSVISMERFMNDTNRWDMEVRPIVGDTDLFIYPFGEGVERQEVKHSVLRDRGFNIFFDVGSGFGYLQGQGFIYFDRRSIDGVYFKSARNPSLRLFDFNKVIDTEARR